MTEYTPALIACPSCDLLVELQDFGVGHRNRCPRCLSSLYLGKQNSITRVLALCLSGLLLSFPAFLWPIMTLNSMGQEVQGSLVDAFLSFISAKYYFVGGMVLLTSIIFPLARFVLLLVVTLFLQTARRPNFLKSWFKTALHLDEWAMLDVYALGIGVTLIKVHGLAEVHFNMALFCLLGITVFSLLISSCLDKEAFWLALTGQSLSGLDVLDPKSKASTARQSGLLVCHGCQCLSPAVNPAPGERQVCYRCRTPLHLYKPQSLTNTWALLIAAVILFIPANVLPIMRVYVMGVPDDSTIMDGIIYFFQHGSFGIGLIILTASVLVPLFKMVGLCILLVSIQRRKVQGLISKTKMFHYVEFVGRWSMLDIFVIALMAILINFGNFTAIVAAPAATYFCLVVITTMLAASSFDSRLLWEHVPAQSTI